MECFLLFLSLFCLFLCVFLQLYISLFFPRGQYETANFRLEPFFKWQADRGANDEENEKN